MRYLTLFTLAACSTMLQAQTPASNASGDASALAETTAGQAAVYAQESVRISAQLTVKIDTRSAHVGDRVSAQTMNDARLSDGTRLTRGTRLAGHVTEVHAKDDGDKTAHLAFSLDRVVLRDGREVAVHAMLAAMAAPSPAANADAMAGAGLGDGGIVGGGRGTTGGGGSMGGTARTSSGTGARTMDPPRADATAIPDDRPVVSNVGESAGSGTALQIRRMPVSNMPGVTLSSGFSASSSGFLDAIGRNISLESGTQLTLNVWGPIESTRF